ncbi:MAG: hypothetical protein KC609_23435 [Myxococcales bacterium]|nr:hypothetical protein [Myxococcales bacterium]
MWGLWLATWLLLLAGLVNRAFWGHVVLFSGLHAVLFFALFRFHVEPFPVQVRIAYFALVAVGTYVPYMAILMYLTILGLATNLFMGYCPLARTVFLFPWNREESFSLDLLRRVFFSPPVAGRFKPKPH